jgi:cell division protein FtsW (lipid II flippase)
MRKFVRKQLTYFLIGFVVAFVVYLFARFDANKVIWGVAVGAGVGIALCIAIAILERRFPDEPNVVGSTRK